MDISKFSKKLDDMERHIDKEIQDVIRDTIFTIHTSLLESKAGGGTPKITGFLRNNWFISFDSPDSSVTGSKKDPGPAQSKQNSAMDKFLTVDLLKYDDIYINNSVSYGEEVNYGKGQDFRKIAVDRGRIILSQAKVIK